MLDGLPTTVPPARTLDGVLGFEFVETSESLARGRVTVEDRVRQPWGLMHGGAYAAFAESLASLGTLAGVHPDGQIGVGLSNNTSFMRPTFSGTVHAEARRRHRGRTTWIWDVEFSDQEGRLCAVSRVTIAVRPAPAEGLDR